MWSVSETLTQPALSGFHHFQVPLWSATGRPIKAKHTLTECACRGPLCLFSLLTFCIVVYAFCVTFFFFKAFSFAGNKRFAVGYVKKKAKKKKKQKTKPDSEV